MKKKPSGIILIGYFYIFGAIVLLVTIATQTEIDIYKRFALELPTYLSIPFKITISVIFLIIAYGFVTFKSWGYKIMIGYSIVFLFISIYLTMIYSTQPYIGNIIWTLFVIIYTIPKKSFFYKSSNANRT